ncbi:Putative 37S ribosomal protein S26A, mitochondrial [Wickerhamiella sorbophila]|uniref:37S ribosomal protein S26A, mitochondrial n=1 Tax=Wickerhamiella sorbophila TaxID=45607 RepID=A0A2T0FPU8_9ASCO|nr:Putative 37S ribosomal protein S26A, mitochondrial [Wickerhamiella sorbophila]PRT57022.1 Putative 37S ribosomal protein S26A, mitochondrial [Wickerhamiella sorbophila]
MSIRAPLRNLLKTSRTWAASRRMHTVPDIGLKQSAGLPGLLSPKGLDIAWFEYQAYVVSKVNQLLEKHPEYNKTADMFELMTQAQASPDPEVKELAVFASQAFNNEFFFRTLRPSVNPNAVVGPSTNKLNVDISTEVLNRPELALPATPVPGQLPLADLNEIIEQSFDSVVSMRELLINRADAMFGNGYVWLVYHMSVLSAVNTYNWASPYSHEDMFSEQGDGSIAELDQSRIKSFAPILCINAWEHVYLHDYGVAGKREYLRNLFDCLDWKVIISRLPARSY